MDHLGDVAVWTVSEPGEFDYISAGFEDIWGIPAAEIETDVDRLIETIHPADRDRVRAAIRQPPEDVSRSSYVARILDADGAIRWVQTQHVPIRDGGELAEIIGISTDITDQKRRERELEALNQVVRHDIRNDMNIILGWADVLGDHVDEAGEEPLSKIVRTGEHVVELTEVAREYGESITDDEGVRVGPQDLRATLRHELERRREMYPEAEFVITGEIPAVDVMADEMLSSVFRNVLNNAVLHNDRDEPTVEISFEDRAGSVAVHVADDGPGIPDARKDAIFGKCERGPESHGSGIGLHLVESLLTEYGGSVRVADNEPTGAVFTVELRKAD
nr:PAS domain-containing sensor histidine kinase [Halostella litorea]